MYNNKKEHFELYNPKLDTIIEVMHFRFVSNILQIWFASVSIVKHNGTKKYGEMVQLGISKGDVILLTPLVHVWNKRGGGV